MPKYKSHSIVPPVIDSETGRVRAEFGNTGQVVLEPLDEAAKLHKGHYAQAIAKGVYTPPAGETQEKVHKTMVQKQYKSVGRPVPREFQD